MYDYIVSQLCVSLECVNPLCLGLYTEFPIYTKQSSDIVCEKVHSEFPDRTVMSKARTYSKTIDTRL